MRIGAGDAAIYPGATPETGEQADLSFYPDAPRLNTLVTKCDLRHSVLGSSGSMGNSVRITKNEVYGNGLGLSTDTISAAGHPGFPADSVEIDHNNIYSNNLDLYPPEHPDRAGRRPASAGDRDLLGRPQQRQRPRQLDLRQLAKRSRSCSRSRTSLPRRPAASPRAGSIPASRVPTRR